MKLKEYKEELKRANKLIAKQNGIIKGYKSDLDRSEKALGKIYFLIQDYFDN